MSPDTHRSADTAERLKNAKIASDNATLGPKKDAATRHYQAAESAHTAGDDEACMRECKEAEAAAA